MPPPVQTIVPRKRLRTGTDILRDDAMRIRKAAAKLGVILALACHFLPHHYRVVCNALVSACTGGHGHS